MWKHRIVRSWAKAEKYRVRMAPSDALCGVVIGLGAMIAQPPKA